MEIKKDTHNDWQIIQPQGRVDSNTAGALEKALLPEAQQPNARVLIDLSELNYISSAGLRVLLMSAKASKKAQGELALSNMADHVKEVFDISGFSSIFTIVDKNEDVLG